MNTRNLLLTATLLCLSVLSYGQADIDSLKREILLLQTDVETIHLNLEKSKSKFQSGIIVATIGYSITIAGGLMLGGDNNDLGEALLIAGGATGITGTFIMADAFKYLGRTRRNNNKP